MQNYLKKTLRAVPALAFLAIAFCVLLSFQDLLYTAHLRTPFFVGAQFWSEMLVEPFGVMRWVGAWLTQFAYYPLLATVIYLLLWGVGYYLLDRALRLPLCWSALAMLPFACLLAGLTGVGYWIYVQRDFGFWFSQSVALLPSLGLLLLFSRARQSWMAVVAACILVLLYPILGWQVALVGLCLAILGIKAWRWAALVLLLPFISPALWHLFAYKGVSAERMWLSGFPVFNDANTYSLRPSSPFMLLAVAMVLLCLAAVLLNGEKEQKRKTFWIVTPVVALAAFFGVKLFSFDDYNFQAEMRMTRAAMEDDWNTVLKEAQKAEEQSRCMVLLKNLALANVGQLGERSFKMGNSGIEIHNPDSIQLNAMHIAAPTVYYGYGIPNYAIRWAVELSVGYGFSPYALMTMIRSAKATGEEELAWRYQQLLRSHIFYRDWEPRPATPFVRTLVRAYDDSLDSDHNNAERYLIELFGRSYITDNNLVRELALFHAMLYCDSHFFWNAFASYMQGNYGKPIPLHYQEGYCAFMNLNPVDFNVDVKISPMVRQSFDGFLRQYNTLKNSGRTE